MTRTTPAATVLFVAAAFGGLAGCKSDSPAPPKDRSAAPAPARAGASDAEVRAMFKRTTDVDLPADAKCIDGQSIQSHCELGDLMTESVYMKFEATEAFKAEMKKLLRSTSNDPEAVMTGDPPPAMSAWDFNEMKGMKVYVGKTKRRPDGRYFKITAAFDDQRPVVYVATGEVVPPAPEPTEKPAGNTL